MVTKNTTVKLDGKSRFTLDDPFTWKNGHLDFVGFDARGTNKDVTVTFNLTGKDWVLTHLEAASSPNLKTVINDATTGSNATAARIETLVLHSALGNDVTLGNTQVDQYDGSDGNDDVTLGAGGVTMMNLGDGNNTLHIGSGRVRSVLAGDGNDRVVTGSGKVDALNLGDGRNTVTVNGTVSALITGDGNDVINVNKGGVQNLDVGDGNNVVNISGAATVGSILGDTDDDKVVIKGNGSATSINVAQGNNTVITGTHTVSTIVAYLGNQTIHVGTGGVSIVRLSDGNSTVEADGHVGMLMAGTGNKRLVFHEAVGTIDMGGGINHITFEGQYVDGMQITDGTDTITLKNGCNLNQVVTGDGDDVIHAERGEIGAAQMGAGNDAIYTGILNIAHATFGDGTDTVYFGDMTNPSNESSFNGGSGIDTMNFENVTKGGVDISLGDSGSQATASGKVRFWNFEKLIGSNFDDTLGGSNGDDFLGGGKGDDQLTGGKGNDTFIFNKGDGADEITDLNLGEADKIDLSSIKSISTFNDVKALMSSDGHGGTLIDFGSGDTLDIDGVGPGRFTDDSHFIL